MKRVLTSNREEGNFVIVNEGQIEDVNLCDCYNQYGQKIDCYDAGCYTITANNSDARDVCLGEVAEKISAKEGDKQDFITELENLNWYSPEPDVEKIKKLEKEYNIKEDILSLVLEWEEENASHTEVKAINYWDGSNWRSIIIENTDGSEDCSFIEEEQEKEILADLEIAGEPFSQDYSHGVAYIHGEKYRFIFSQYAGFAYCEAEEL